MRPWLAAWTAWRRPGVQRDSAGKIVGWSGFGNLSAYSARLVLQSVSDVTPQEIDYSKAASVTKSDIMQLPNPGAGLAGDPVDAAHAAAKAFGVGNQAGDQIERAAAAFGKKNEHNGVIVNFRIANEVPKNEGAKGTQDSPDGVLYNCTFNMDRLMGDALSRAIVHSGTLVAEIRNPQPEMQGDGLYEMEFRAWATTSFSAVAMAQKTLTVYGGILLFNSAWGPDERSAKLGDALKALLVGEGLTVQ